YNDDSIVVRVRVKTKAETGVEMEALAGVSAALLAIWDMVKKYEKDEAGQYPVTRITNIRVVSKIKGSS
ncbi:MAG: cyclic pyranopterin monophosphate synthase MoaC, partial [Desulfurococcales archaeon]|nr:cyclic pyranopterin monophosphate synthase MoaC [Desulfurococcales archaeon]